MRGILFMLGLVIAQIFIPGQTSAFAQISPAATGRASTLFNMGRQVGSALGVAVLSTVLVGVGSTQAAGGVTSPSLTGYHWAFATAALFALAGTGFSLTMHDSDAAETMVRRGRAAARQTEQSHPLSENVA